MPKHAKYPTTGSSTGTRISGPNAYVSDATFSSWTFGDANSAAGDLATQTSSSPRNFIIQISPRNSDFTSKIQIFAHELRQSLTAEELKCEANQLDHVIEKLAGESKKKKKIRVISTADESVSSRKDISTSLFKKKKKRRWSWNEEVQKEATVGYQQKRRGARYGMSCDDISLDVITISSWLSADETKRERRSDVVLRFSRWINVDDVIGDVIQSQESAGSLHPDAKRKRRRRGDPVASYSAISRRYLEIAIAKRCRLHNRLGSQAQRIEEGAKCSSRRNISAAKQLTNYQSWMSTAELNSKWRKRQKPAK
ncbi:hypothetical protein F511_15489 [Dorcoceras hygrometricum]|uniref:Uncharacterized protein n=1 Tax=Dorcoceras hygrometricum TaxID=472368 RepID=A0A2Z7BPM9_9LAMI|nr:hypothetical protein F511_15489 [Dorcoceras hygrometricum]